MTQQKDDMLTRIAMLIAAKQRRSNPGQPEWEFLGAEKRSEFQLLAFDILKELEKPSAIMVQCGDNAIRDAIPEGADHRTYPPGQENRNPTDQPLATAQPVKGRREGNSGRWCLEAHRKGPEKQAQIELRPQVPARGQRASINLRSAVPIN